MFTLSPANGKPLGTRWQGNRESIIITATLKNTMKTYQITIKDNSILNGKEYTGKFKEDPDGHGVELEAREWYACELDCNIDDIEIIKTIELK